eukprot:31231-Pelagococcus_subviridis.AAC.6
MKLALRDLAADASAASKTRLSRRDFVPALAPDRIDDASAGSGSTASSDSSNTNLREGAANRQPEPAAAVLVHLVIRHAEPVEDVLHRLLRHPLTGVDHLEEARDGLVIRVYSRVARHLHGNDALRRELDRVPTKVGQDLLDPTRVADERDVREERRYGGHEPQVFRARRRVHLHADAP